MAAAIDRAREEGEAGAVIDFAFHLWIYEDLDYIAQVPEAVARGVSFFKVMMSSRKAGRGQSLSDNLAYAAFEATGRAGGIALLHAENALIVDLLAGRAAAEGLEGAEYQRRARPPILEAEAISRCAHLSALADCPLYIVHFTSKEALAEVRRRRAEGRRALGARGSFASCALVTPSAPTAPACGASSRPRPGLAGRGRLASRASPSPGTTTAPVTCVWRIGNSPYTSERFD